MLCPEHSDPGKLKGCVQTTLEQLCAIVGEDGCAVDPDPDNPLLIDERGNFRGRAAAIVFPRSVDEVADVVGVCVGAGIPLVPQGGNTGYCGGATPDQSGTAVVVNLSRMNRVRAIDRVACTMTAEAGVVLQDAQVAATEHGLLLPLAMGSQGSCQLGGNISTNAGGLSVLRYGTAAELVGGLEVVLPDGRVFSDLGGLRKDNTGYDLKQLFMGAEGTLGVITAAVLRLQPLPRFHLTAWLAISGVDDALILLDQLRQRLGDCITSFEYIARDALTLVTREIPELHPPVTAPDCDHALIELVAFDDGGSVTSGFEQVMSDGIDSGRISDVAVAQNESQRGMFWSLRESIPAAEKRAGGSVKHDVSVALGVLPAFARDLSRSTSERFAGVRLSVYGHVGDGNLHFNVLAPAGQDVATYKAGHAEAISAFVHESAVRSGGSFSAEHGIGQLKRDVLRDTAPPVALELMRQLKDALDPHGLMNPGKVV